LKIQDKDTFKKYLKIQDKILSYILKIQDTILKIVSCTTLAGSKVDKDTDINVQMSTQPNVLKIYTARGC